MSVAYVYFEDEPDPRVARLLSRDEGVWSHAKCASRMMIGIGTPSNQEEFLYP